MGSVVRIVSGAVGVMMSRMAFGAAVMVIFVVLAPHHGERGSSGSSAETSFGNVHFLVLCAVLELQELVSCEGRGSHSDHKVYVFTKIGISGEV
jgi:hypothetical protein